MARIRRCTCLKATAALAVPALCRELPSAVDRIRLGIIGCGGRGRRLIQIFLQDPDLSVVVVSDVIEPRMAEAARWLDRTWREGYELLCP